MSWRGLFAGALALIALEAIVRTDESADRFGGIFESLGDLARKFISPTVAAIPDLGGGTSSGAGGGSDPGGGFSGGGGGGSGGGSSW